MISYTFRLEVYDPLDDSSPGDVVGVRWADSPEQRKRAHGVIRQFNSMQLGRRGSCLLMRIHECDARECLQCLARELRLERKASEVRGSTG